MAGGYSNNDRSAMDKLFADVLEATPADKKEETARQLLDRFGKSPESLGCNDLKTLGTALHADNVERNFGISPNATGDHAIGILDDIAKHAKSCGIKPAPDSVGKPVTPKIIHPNAPSRNA